MWERLLAGLSHGARVDDRQHLFEVVDHRSVEQRLVAFLPDTRSGVCRAPAAKAGRLLEGVGDLQHAEVVVAPAHDLKADG